MAAGRTWQKARIALGKAGAARKRGEGLRAGRTLVVDGKAYHMESLGNGLVGDADGNVLERGGEVWRIVEGRILRVEAHRWYAMGGERRGFEFSGVRGA